MSLHPMQERVSARPAMTMALFTAILSILVLGSILFEVLPATGWYQDHSFQAPVSWFIPYMVEDIHNVWKSSSNMAPLARLNALPATIWSDCVLRFDLLAELRPRLIAIVMVAALSGTVAGLTFFGACEPKDALVHLSGRRLWRGYPAVKMLQRILISAIKSSGKGINLAPGIALGWATEVQHFGLFGTTGSGKTTILRFFIEQIIAWLSARGDKLLIHDTKGDMLEGLPTDDFVLLAPQDERSHAWDVARDVLTTQDARELAVRLIHESREPMWSSAARDILTGVIISLQRAKPKAWSWQDLADTVFLAAAELQSLLLESYPPAGRYIEMDDDGAPTRTTHGILISLWADIVGIILPLADAWGTVPQARRVSLSAWITDESGKLPKALVLQRSPQYPALSAIWIGAAVNCLASIAASPALPESKHRRIWLVLDEFTQLGRLKSFLQLLEVGRSKGIVCMLALQDIQQLTATYGEAAAKTILTLLGTKIIGKLPAGPSAKAIVQDLIGQRDVTWREEVVTRSEDKSSHTSQSHRANIPVVTEEQLESRLGADRHGVKALVLGFGDVFELHWPFLIWPARRLATKLAGWVSR